MNAKALLELATLHNLPMAAPPAGPLEATQGILDRLIRSGDAQLRDGIYHRTAKGDMRLKGPRTPCCQKLLMGLGGEDLPAICWNPDNGVVQCHACGEIFIPASSSIARAGRGIGDFAYDLWTKSGCGSKRSRTKTDALG